LHFLARLSAVALSSIYGRISALSDGLIFLAFLGSFGLAAPGLIPIDLSLALAFSPTAFSHSLSLSAGLALHSFATLSPSRAPGHFGSRGAFAGCTRRDSGFTAPAHAAAAHAATWPCALSHALG
jgi:hypothetical protein